MHSSHPGPIHERRYIWNPLVATNGSTLSASFPPLPSFPPKWGRTLRLSLEVGMSDLKGKPASAYLCCWWSLEACTRTLWWCQVGTRAQNQPYYRVFRRSRRILQTAVVDLEHSWTFGATEMFLFWIGRWKHSVKLLNLIPTQSESWLMIPLDSDESFYVHGCCFNGGSKKSKMFPRSSSHKLHLPRREPKSGQCFTGSAYHPAFTLKCLIRQFLTHCLSRPLVHNCFLFPTCITLTARIFEKSHLTPERHNISVAASNSENLFRSGLLFGLMMDVHRPRCWFGC